MATPKVGGQQQQTLKPEGTQTNISRVFVVLNPVAGLTDADNAKQTIEQFCSEHGWDCDIHETKKDEDVRQLVADVLKKGVDLVIAAGGDGTVSSVVAGMIGSETPMAILPAGTGNNLARDLSVPLDLPGALNLLANQHSVHVMDVMQVNQEKFYVLNVSVGISSLTMRTTQRNEKRRFGMLAYIYRAVGSIRNSAMHRFQVLVDEKPVRFSATEVMITNSKLMGLQPQLYGVEVDPNDGRLDIFIVRAQTVRDYFEVVKGFVVHHERNSDTVLNHLEAYKTIRIESEFPLPVQADGEEIGTTPVDIRLLPNALRVIAPEPADSGG